MEPKTEFTLTRKAFAAVSKAVDLEAGIFEAMISTEAVDRSGDIVRATGAKIDNYLKNPVVLWAHNYDEPPIAKALSIEIIPGVGLKARFQFPEWGMNPQADVVRRLWAGGFLNATSIGFMPLAAQPVDPKDADETWYWGPWDYVSWELLEFSVVPVPANQEALRLAVKNLTTTVANLAKSGRVLSAANEGKIKNAVKLLQEVLDQLAQPEEDSLKAAVPYADHGTADSAAAWSKPNLSDFTDQGWADLTTAERKRIMAHFAWTAANPPETFGDLKLPHHQPQTTGIGPAVWRGVTGAMARLNQTSTDVPDADYDAVYAHLSKHYAEFDQTPPDKKSTEVPIPEQVPGEMPVTPPADAQPTIPDDTERRSKAQAEAISTLLDTLFAKREKTEK
jgi:phage head maturation protease